MTSNTLSTDTSSKPPTSGLDIAAIPLSLYVHVPWCVKKCPYCDFNSHKLTANQDFAGYVDALIADAADQQAYVQGRVITSIFFGGGTPSLLPVAELSRLLASIRTLFRFADDIEITLEANPGTLEHAPFSDYLALGINRLSLGVQSFSDSHLTRLGRVHGSDEAMQAIRLAAEAGFERINVDLMHGLPEQSCEAALYDIRTAVSCGATHLSWYQLTIEPNTAFYRDKPVLPNEEVLQRIQTQGETLLRELGFQRYEVSAWTRELPSQHNMNYWQFGDYLAIGAGAHGKVTLTGHDTLAEGVYRFQNSRLPRDYLAHIPAKRIKMSRILPDDMACEFMMNALRLDEGVAFGLLSQRTGLSDEAIEQVKNILDGLVSQKLIVEHYADNADANAANDSDKIAEDVKAREIQAKRTENSLENQQANTGNRLKCTALGLRYLNRVLDAFQ